MKSIDF